MILDGKQLAIQLRKQLKAEIKEFTLQYAAPGLDVILVGDDPASQIYVKSKVAACERAGILSNAHYLPKNVSQETLEELIHSLNENPLVHGILLQLPLPPTLNTQQAISLIQAEKDVDGLNVANLGKLLTGEEGLFPCTPVGCMSLLEKYNIPIAGKHAVVLGRSNLVGKPIALMLLQKNATVTIAHSKTHNIQQLVQTADIVVAAVGSPHLVKQNWLKKDAVVLDVGINRLEDGSIVGDVDFENAKKNCFAITPVPGGVGPMTIATLLLNTFQTAKRQMM